MKNKKNQGGIKRIRSLEGKRSDEGGVAILNRSIGVDFIQEVSFEQKMCRNEGIKRHLKEWACWQRECGMACFEDKQGGLVPGAEGGKS